MKATVHIELDNAMRQRITERMSTAMGSYIVSTGKTDFATWSPEEWQQLVGVAFDVCAPDVFMRRLVLVPPYIEEQAPY